MSDVYGLMDPNTFEIRYVGQAIFPSRRLAGHIATARNRSYGPRVYNWIRSLDQHPLLVILEADPVDIAAAERGWIRRLKSRGARLLNSNPGRGASYA